MIIVKLQGGLGNQMFQYAVGKQLSLYYQQKLKLDLSFLLDRSPKQNFTYRDYNLDIFSLKVDFASSRDIYPFMITQGKGIKSKIFNKIINPITQKNYVKESDYTYNSSIFNFRGNLYLDGYWQSHLYFNNIHDLLKKDFSVKQSLVNYSAVNSVLNLIQNSNSVCLHIRRGDYISNSVVANFHGFVGLEYIYLAVEKIKKLIHKPHFFVFSDDINWCQKNLNIYSPHDFISSSSPEGLATDFYLMQSCKHFLISNSSFSWWAAWLGSYRQKVVICPIKWFSNSTICTDFLIPDHWIKL